MVVMMPVVLVTFRIALLFASAMYKLLRVSVTNPQGTFNKALVAELPSPEEPPVPVPV